MDPFPTKGIEYLLIIGYLAVFVPFVWLLSRIGRQTVGEIAPDDASEPQPRKTPWFHVPDPFHLHRGHTWAVPLGEKLVKVGMDDFAHRLIGDATAFRLPRPGYQLQQGEKGWQVQAGGDTVDLLSPVDGEIVELNEEVLRTPSLASDDPYGQGWLMKVRVPSDRAAIRNLLPSRLANVCMCEENAELSRMVGEELGPVLQDGGVPVRGFARELAGDDWPKIAAKFFLTV